MLSQIFYEEAAGEPNVNLFTAVIHGDFYSLIIMKTTVIMCNSLISQSLSLARDQKEISNVSIITYCINSKCAGL